MGVKVYRHYARGTRFWDRMRRQLGVRVASSAALMEDRHEHTTGARKRPLR